MRKGSLLRDDDVVTQEQNQQKTTRKKAKNHSPLVFRYRNDPRLSTKIRHEVRSKSQTQKLKNPSPLFFVHLQEGASKR